LKPSALPGALRRRAGACLNAFTHPGARAAAVLCLLAALLFVLYFQFFFGPPLLTLAVLAVCAYAGLTAYNAACDAMARAKDEPSRVAGFLTRHNLQDSWVFLLCAAVSLLSNLFFLLMAAYVLLLGGLRFGEENSRHRHLKITVPENVDYDTLFEDLLEQYTSRHELLKVRTTNMGTLYELTYDLQIKGGDVSKDFIDELRCRNGNLNIICGRESDKDML
jgi:hypothetical protein